MPFYYLLRFSDLAREGFENSGSYRFADHIYRGEPSGRGWIGRWIDGRLLAMPAVRSFRSRFLASRDALAAFLAERAGSGQVRPAPDATIDVLSAPSGIPRELVEGARLFVARGGSLAGVRFHALDLDRAVLDQARRFALQNGLPDLITHHGDALDRRTYPARASFVTCTGLGEFLDDERLLVLYATFHDVLEPGGVLVTSGMGRRRLADYLLRIAEIDVRYRGAGELTTLARRAGFSRIETRPDAYGIQTVMIASR
jgi:SAM-dependent methyltransferase